MSRSGFLHARPSRSLLRGRRIQRPRVLGMCPRCGATLAGRTECWSGFEALLSEHASHCSPSGFDVPNPEAPRWIVIPNVA